MNEDNQFIVFTDLDGSFLDHHTYDYSPALPAVKRLKALNISIIPVTSKTMAEIEALNLPFGDVPQIAENGMVTKKTDGELTINEHYHTIIQFINDLPVDLHQYINGFNDMSVKEIIHNTGMSKNKALLAKQRQASEPFLWLGKEEQLTKLKDLAHKQNLDITRGGRFYHLMGQGGKAESIQSLIQTGVTSIALGDGPNDADMLACVDYGIKIPNENGHDFDVPNPKGKIINAPAPGPTGWNLSINALLDNLHLKA